MTRSPSTNAASPCQPCSGVASTLREGSRAARAASFVSFAESCLQLGVELRDLLAAVGEWELLLAHSLDEGFPRPEVRHPQHRPAHRTVERAETDPHERAPPDDVAEGAQHH